jgi:hypothetical protein
MEADILLLELPLSLAPFTSSRDDPVALHPLFLSERRYSENPLTPIANRLSPINKPNRVLQPKPHPTRHIGLHPQNYLLKSSIVKCHGFGSL